tara:strand:- start:70 stop:441 length:372 start_codon:yes stop_codon:yes gene_type:complete
MKKIIMIVGLLVVVVIGVFAFTGGPSDSSDGSGSGDGTANSGNSSNSSNADLSTLLDEYENKTDKMIADMKDGNYGAAATYTKWVSEWTEKWTKAVDNMDASEIAKYAERINQILEKAANAAY